MPGESQLGKRSDNPERYAPDLLHGIARAEARRELGLKDGLPFSGVDIWNAYELSWLDERGKPVVGVGEFVVPASSPNIVESKSFKLYLGSLNGVRYASREVVAALIATDLGEVLGGEAQVRIRTTAEVESMGITSPPGVCIDAEDASIDCYQVSAGLLQMASEQAGEVAETLHSNLLKSNCPVTGQPDWATVIFKYRGPRIDRAALLRYVVSYREHQAFHEHCIERMFADVMQRCGPSELSVYGRYTRRGGLDINPFRSNFESLPENLRFGRQ